MKIRIPGPRNPYVALALQRKAGSHRKPVKAQRRGDKSRAGGWAHEFAEASS